MNTSGSSVYSGDLSSNGSSHEGSEVSRDGSAADKGLSFRRTTFAELAWSWMSAVPKARRAFLRAYDGVAAVANLRGSPGSPCGLSHRPLRLPPQVDLLDKSWKFQLVISLYQVLVWIMYALDPVLGWTGFRTEQVWYVWTRRVSLFTYLTTLDGNTVTEAAVALAQPSRLAFHS